LSTFLKNENKQLLVGLTGGIGSGKSTVAKIFKSLGVPIFNSDTEAKNIINTNTEVIKQINAEFGAIYDEGKLNTQKMAKLVFSDKKALDKLNKIVHPRVKKCFELWVDENEKAPILIKEAAILIESGAYQQMDKVILVIASEAVRIQRVTVRDNVSEDKVKSRIQAQYSDKEKSNHADFIINNSGEELIIPQVLEIYSEIKNLN